MAKPKCIPSQDYLQSILQYKEGNLYWKIRPSQGTKIGDIAGSISGGYGQIYIHNCAYKVHRIIFMMFNGFMPKQIDHIDGNPSNNKIENLRETDYFTNNYNKKIMSNSKSGVKGVNWHKGAKKWRVEVCFNKKNQYLGLFEDIELAELVAIEAREKYHKEFARHL
jgi:hypothetical protein